MSCPHSLKPGPCSQCMRAVPRLVSIDGTTIDGKPTGRTLETSAQVNVFYQRRKRKHVQP